MDPHELAIAALGQVAESSRRDPGAGHVATGVDMADNASPVTTLQPSQQPPPLRRAAPASASTAAGESLEDARNPTLGLQSTWSDQSQSTADGPDVSTPPTSTSDGFSSQGTNPDGHRSQLSQLSQLAAAAQPMMTSTSAAAAATRPSLAMAPASGLKRTADGHVKPSPCTSPTSPQDPRIRGHSRNTSTVSVASTASSKIGELSSELRTRLSYAMVKVNKGWQSNSIDEVESLASQAGSPTSSTSTLHGRRSLLTSPRTNIAGFQGQSSMHSPALLPQAPSQDFYLYSGGEPPSRTYESFWRDHSSHPLPTQRSHAIPTRLSLAPPAEIRPTPSSRRSHTPRFSRPPALPAQGSNSSLSTTTPRTPNGRNEYMDAKAMNTPTQKTIQEQDAMEALLFMSSPGNSGNLGPSHAFPPPRSQMSPQQSPLRAEFGVEAPLRATQGRRAEFERVERASTSTGSSETCGYSTKGKALRRGKERSEAIDRLLDEMVDSSSDEDLPLNYESLRKPREGPELLSGC